MGTLYVAFWSYNLVMLVARKNEVQTPVGLAVMTWKIDGDPRTMVLYPFDTTEGQFVSLEILTQDDGYSVIEPASKEWSKVDEWLEDDSEGYPADQKVAKMLYKVWDDSRRTHPKDEQALYKFYEPLIKHFTPSANKHIRQLFDARRALEREEAKAKGWDTTTASKYVPEFPYTDNEPCVVCGFLCGGSIGDICPVCGWENEGFAPQNSLESSDGPNHELSIFQAKKNFAEVGACKKRSLAWVTAPKPEWFIGEFEPKVAEQIKNLQAQSRKELGIIKKHPLADQ
jgi:rubrerythrin